MISAVVLAAGRSSRMKKDKLLASLNSGTVIGHTLENVLSSQVEEIIVVLGHRAEEKEKYLKSKFHGIKTVINQDYHMGLSTSVRKGLEALDSSCEAVVFCPGDLPLVGSAVINGIIREFQKQHCWAVYPVYRGVRGNPVLFSSKAFPLFQDICGDEGGRSVIVSLGEKACKYETDCEGVLQDIDTPVDLQKIKNAFK